MKMSQNTPDKDEQTASNKKTISLPISRVRLIMKSSPDVSSINQDALFLTTKATVSRTSLINLLQLAGASSVSSWGHRKRSCSSVCLRFTFAASCPVIQGAVCSAPGPVFIQQRPREGD